MYAEVPEREGVAADASLLGEFAATSSDQSGKTTNVDTPKLGLQKLVCLQGFC
jgi:hypothetical protein